MGTKPDFTTCCFSNPLINLKNRLLGGEKGWLGIGRWNGRGVGEPA